MTVGDRKAIVQRHRRVASGRFHNGIIIKGAALRAPSRVRPYSMTNQPTPLTPGPQFYEVAPRRFWPVATIVLLALNFVFFGLEIYAGGFDNTAVLLNFGASFGPYLRRGEYWRLVMPIFLHGGWLHILGNSYALYILGPVLGRVDGYGRHATLYVAAGM